MQVALLAPVAFVAKLSEAELELTAGAYASHGSGHLQACDSDESIEVWICVPKLGSAGHTIKAVRAPRRMTLTGLQGEAFGFPVGAGGMGSEEVQPSSGGFPMVVCGFLCDGRYVGRLEATLVEAGVQSGSRIEVVLGRRGGSGHGSGQAEGERLP